MGFKVDYLRAYERLPNDTARCFKVLVRERDAVLMSMRAFFMRTVDARKDRLFDVDSFWHFSSSLRSSPFTEYDAFVIDILGHSPDFLVRLEKAKDRSASNESATVEAFLKEAFKDRPGSDGPIANRYYRSFVAWLGGRDATRLTRPIVFVALKVNSDSWLRDHETERVGSSGEAFTALFTAFLLFIRDRCHTALDRQLALFMQSHLLDRPSLIPFKEVEAELRRYRYDSNLSERELRLRLDLVRRRFVSFLLSEGFHAKLPSSFYEDRTDEDWARDLMNVAKVDDLSRAKALVDMGPDFEELPQPCPKGSMRGLARHYRKRGVKTKLSRRAGRQVLELWYSFGLSKSLDRPVTVVRPDGTFVDSVTGMTGNIRGYL
jgi:hypothetical protein